MLIAVDTGGTKTLIARFDKDGAISESTKFPTPRDQSEYVAAVKTAVETIANNQPVNAIVIALPGILKNGVAVWCNNLGWSNFKAQKTFEAAFPGIKILIENDANLAGLAETRMLDKIPVSSLYVTISTGIGSGVITNGSIDPGLRNSEAGHSMVEFDGIVQEWEKFASGSAIYRTYNSYARDIKSKRIWNQIADRISRGFLAIIPVIQPEIIIIGGSMGTFFDQYSAQLSAILKEKLPNHIPCPKLVAAAHPEEAVIYGCYYYAVDELSTTSS